MPSAPPDLEELTREKTFWQLNRAVGKLPRSFVYRFFVVETVVATLAASLTFIGQVRAAKQIELMTKVMEQGFSIAVQILAFGLAGLAIYAAALASDLATPMAETPYKETGMSTLKVNALAFVRVFRSCFYTIAAYFVWIVFFPPGGLPFQFAAFLFRSGRPWDLLLACCLGASVFIVTHLLVGVQLFLFDLHHVVMSFARGKVMLDSRSRKN